MVFWLLDLWCVTVYYLVVVTSTSSSCVHFLVYLWYYFHEHAIRKMQSLCACERGYWTSRVE